MLTTTDERPAELSAPEQERLTELESVIGAGKDEFLRVGEALVAIREEGLYRGGFGTFADYCQQRWNLPPSQAVAVAKVIGPIHTKAAATRKKATQVQNRDSSELAGGEKFTPPGDGVGKARDKVAEAVGMSAPTLAKATAVVDAATAHPDAYGDIAAEMDATGKVAPAYERLAERAAQPDAPPVKLPHKPKAAKPPAAVTPEVTASSTVADATDEVGAAPTLVGGVDPGRYQPTDPDAPWAAFERQIRIEQGVLRGVADRLRVALDYDAEAKRVRCPWATFLSYSGTVGQVNALIRDLDNNMPGEVSAKPPGYAPVRDVKAREKTAKREVAHA